MKVLLVCWSIVAVSASQLEKQFQDFKYEWNVLRRGDEGAESGIFKRIIYRICGTNETNHGKNYRNQIEDTKRFNNFKENLRSIDEHNALYEQGLSSYKKGITKFADMTQEEFKATLTLSSSNKPHFNRNKHINTGIAIPDSVDWRTDGQVTDVKDQGDCSSYWAFSMIGSIEAAYKRSTGNLVSLSAQQLVDCSTYINDGCRSGYPKHAIPYVEKYGIQSEESYPYTASADACKFSANSVVANVSDFNATNPEYEDDLLDAVANVGPVSVEIDASFLYTYESGIYEDDRCSPSGLNSAALIVGYETEDSKPFWIIKNSWGTSFGENGYFRLVRGQNECGITEDALYPII